VLGISVHEALTVQHQQLDATDAVAVGILLEQIKSKGIEVEKIMLMSVWPDSDMWSQWLEPAVDNFRRAGVKMVMCHTYFYLDNTQIDIYNLPPVPRQIHDDDRTTRVRDTKRYDFRCFFPKALGEQMRINSWYNIRRILDHPSGDTVGNATVIRRGCRAPDTPEMQAIATVYEVFFRFWSRSMATPNPIEPPVCMDDDARPTFRDMLANVIGIMEKHGNEFYSLIRYS